MIVGGRGEEKINVQNEFHMPITLSIMDFKSN